MELRLVNLTPHELTLRGADGQDTVLRPSGTVARVTASPGPLRRVQGLPVPVALADRPGPVSGLPPEQDEVFFVVSAVVGREVAHRRDVLVPGTGPEDNCVRNQKGHVVAVTRLKFPR